MGGRTAFWGGIGMVVLPVLCGSCEESSEVRTIDKTRIVAGSTVPVEKATSAERFGLRPMGPASAPKASGASGASGPMLVWDTPPGWVEIAPTTFRVANFQVAGDERAECYLTVLSGDGGGLAANIGRWRQQMGVAPMTAEEIAALPHAKLFGRDALEVDFTGTWSGMDGSQKGEGYRLVGLLLVESIGSAFLKMTGPEDVLADELDAFRTLAGSFRTAKAHDDVAASNGNGSMAALSGSTAASGGSTAAPSGAPVAGSSSGITWKAPDGWRRSPDRPTRTVSFFVGEGEDAECYVTLLPGGAGGSLANVNRWRKQMGREEIAPEELERLPRVPLLGGQGVLAEVDGSFNRDGGDVIEGALLVGVVASLGDRAVFVKMTGPRARVEPQREAFLAFCRSLTWSE